MYEELVWYTLQIKSMLKRRSTFLWSQCFFVFSERERERERESPAGIPGGIKAPNQGFDRHIKPRGDVKPLK